MKREIGKLVVSLLLFLSATAFANTLELKSLNKNQLVGALKGKTVVYGPGAYIAPNKLIDNTIAVYYAPDGKIKGKWENPVEGHQQTDIGTWTVKENGVECNDWKEWGKFCIYYYSLNNHYLLLSEDKKMGLLVAKNNFSEGDSVKVS